ncbi:zinc finger C2HC domain-containing protein 1B-like [Corvus cornix cornix]|uniref:zinc finger C2HC domain-containing protein 1B-like n=1 Tax=Corvus brachyrhynchos TaxID=85066 RepID=UPI0008166975|nr:PREDICTED: zinc finger C2HC domain-containing protein 1B-like [Corvus brachyrhynchos]XP_039424520.1 zinc finger C2HC domain-containing protein 1B-like [Corvus cornix cornix]
MCQESLQQKVQALQHLETETLGKRNHLREEAAPAKDYIQHPCCSQMFNEAPPQRNMEFCEEQAVCHAANSTRQALDKQPLTERKTPSLTTAVLSLLERVQKGANTDKHKAEITSEILKKTGKSLGVSTGKNSSGKSGMAQRASILHPGEMYTTVECEFLGQNVVKNDSL